MCLDDQILSTYLDDELTEPWKSQVEEHLSYCQACKSRLLSLEKLKKDVRHSVLSDEEIKQHQDHVLSVLEKNYLNKKSKKVIGFFKKQVKLSLVQIMGAAAAFVIIFAGSWTVFRNHRVNVIDVPKTDKIVDISNITPVMGTQKKSLEDFSVEEIMNYLDSKGYDVVITLKGIQPLSN